MLKVFYTGFETTIAYAATELKRVLALMDTALEIAILAMPRHGSERGCWLGTFDQLGVDGPKVENVEYDDAYVIDMAGTAGVIAGSNPRSVLLAVYRYLRELGCAWVRPGRLGEIIPHAALGDRQVQVREAASYRHRGVCIEGAVNYDHVVDVMEWLPKVGLNGYFNQFGSPFSFYDNWYQHRDNPEIPSEEVTQDEVSGMVRDQMRIVRQDSLMYHAMGHGWTCAPYGVNPCGWYEYHGEIPEEMKEALALVDGRRELYRGIPLITNLCYSNPAVREKMADAVVDYCREHPDMTHVHVWLGDAMNNQCECEMCRKQRPADHYVELLNLINQRLQEAGIPARVVFLVYYDLMWKPLRNRLNNPDRFVLMFAPITRTYSSSYEDVTETAEVPPFELNRLRLPSSVAENTAFLRDWQTVFRGDSFIYDYHLWRDYALDAGQAHCAEVLFRDMRYLKSMGLNGMVSCQTQRNFCPSPIAVNMMADALWNRDADYDACLTQHYRDAYGSMGPQVRTYLEKLSVLMDSAYLRGEMPRVNMDMQHRFEQAEAHIRAFQPVVEDWLTKHPEEIPARRRSFEILRMHAALWLLLCRALQARAAGNPEEMEQHWQETLDFAQKQEKAFQDVFDLFMFRSVLEESLRREA